MLDTHLVLWTAQASARRSQAAIGLIEDLANEVFFSAASIWEVAIKTAKGRADFMVDAERLRQEMEANGYKELAVKAAHGAATVGLPMLHKDPFDRLLVAQAGVEGLVLLTVDAVVARYPGPVRKV